MNLAQRSLSIFHEDHVSFHEKPVVIDLGMHDRVMQGKQSFLI